MSIAKYWCFVQYFDVITRLNTRQENDMDQLLVGPHEITKAMHEAGTAALGEVTYYDLDSFALAVEVYTAMEQARVYEEVVRLQSQSGQSTCDSTLAGRDT